MLGIFFPIFPQFPKKSVRNLKKYPYLCIIVTNCINHYHLIMKIKTILIILSLFSPLLLLSCKKDALAEVITTGNIIPVIGKDTVTAPTNVFKRTISVGTGSGALTIDGKTLGLQCDDLINIKSGTYTSIDIKNILSKDGCPITIKNQDGIVKISGDFNQMALTDLRNVTISGDGTKGVEKGFVFRDNKYRAIQIQGTLNKFTLQHVSFVNIGDADIAYIYRAVYTGAEDSYSKDLKFLNISCDNTQQFFASNGAIENGNVLGLIKNLEIANLDFRNSPSVGAVVYLGNVEDFNIHHNRVDNVNTSIDNHNGIFSISGNGRFHDNFVSNHQGNAIRAWGFTVGTTAKTILIYNNIVVNSRKYSAFEVQAFDFNIIPGKTTYTDAIVFNNTCGNLNTSADWQANVVDVYSLKGGKCEVYNNLAYNFSGSIAIAGQEAELSPVTSNNLYFKTRGEAGLIDETEFKLNNNSSAKRAGRTTPIAITDYYGAPRNQNTPSLGAVE